MSNLELFNDELNSIKSQSVREFTRFCLENAPSYFWEVASSSTGKYHPAESNGLGGLVRHTKAAVYFANKLCDVYSVLEEQRDIVISATILHDLVKYGNPKQKFTTKTHGYEAARYIEDLVRDKAMISKSALDAILHAIEWHFGRWTKVPAGQRTKNFPEDFSYIDRIVHLADVVSAQKEVSLGFLAGNLPELDKEFTVPFGKHAGKRIDEIPTDYLTWMSNNINDTILKNAAKAELEVRIAARAGK